MSVPVPKRKIGKLDVNIAACELCKGIIEITNNSNVFAEEYRSITDKMRDAALDIHLLCWEANNINVGDSFDRYERRAELQSEAVDACNRLCALIELSKRLFHLPTRRAVHWIDETVKVRNKIQSWKNSNMRDLRPKGQ